jgi:RNA polymerase sigma-70 factor (sigma-E family)
LTGDRGAAEDLVQEVFERLYVAWPRIDDPSAYAQRALVNRGTNRWRQRSRHPETTLTEAHDGAVGDTSTLSDDRDSLIRVIALLPARQRAVIVLRYLEDLSEAETAQALSCSVGTVKSQTSRALARLRELLNPAPATPTVAMTTRSVR